MTGVQRRAANRDGRWRKGEIWEGFRGGMALKGLYKGSRISLKIVAWILPPCNRYGGVAVWFTDLCRHMLEPRTFVLKCTSCQWTAAHAVDAVVGWGPGAGVLSWETPGLSSGWRELPLPWSQILLRFPLIPPLPVQWLINARVYQSGKCCQTNSITAPSSLPSPPSLGEGFKSTATQLPGLLPKEPDLWQHAKHHNTLYTRSV